MKEFEQLSAADQRNIARRIDALAQDPRPPGIKQIEKGIYRLRAGNYRVVYQVEDKIVLVLILKIGHRREVYRALSRALRERRGPR